MNAARWWRLRPDGRAECRLCPRFCKLRDGQWGFCQARRRRGDRIELPAYGRTSGLCVDPIEKKPLYHFLPGTTVLSFGTSGCNLGCRFCQNWGLSRARGGELRGESAPAAGIADAARRLGCRSVAFTYNEPIIFAEYALETAAAARERGLKTVAVTAGYIAPGAREDFFRGMDAANVDLKGFTEGFYGRMCRARLQPVLDTLEYLRRETAVWLEVTTILIPGENDGAEEIDRASDWFAARLGAGVPWHFTAFHPDGALLDRAPTPLATLWRARDVARSKGIRHVYIGNARDPEGETTRCPGCGEPLIERDGFDVVACRLDAGRCPSCGERLAGCFEDGPFSPTRRV